MAEELEKKILKAPTLPNHIQGDGRYLMSLLKSFLEQTATQVNLANGFSAEEINPEQGGYPTPRDFFLSFNRLGGEFTWSHIYDVSELAYYELRVDQNIGNNMGLLERTLNNYSSALPVDYSATVYLYAVSKDGVYSNPSTLSYTKARPDAPTDITVTNTAEGTLVTFREIPTNCIGANIYIDGKKYQSTDNVFLVKDSPEMEVVEVAYYDSFGEGERGTLYLVLPDVTGFLVERNGAELDFYWDAVNVYGVKYVVKVGATSSWEQATELFRTATNDKNRRLYPNTGTYYLLVKAYDENGNYSRNAAYQVMNNEADIYRNVILEYDQQDTLYGGNKINLYYDPTIEGVTLDRETAVGEYIFDVQLPQKYRARNWINYEAISFTSNDLAWEDCDFSWEDADIRWAGTVGNVDSSLFRQEIALKQDADVHDLLNVDLNGDLESEQKTQPFKIQHADTYETGRWALGLKTDMLTMLAYDIPNTKETFSAVYWFKTVSALENVVLCTMTNASGDAFLIFGYDARLKEFYLEGSEGEEIRIPFTQKSAVEFFMFGISQSTTERSLYIYVYSEDKVLSKSVKAEPVGVISKFYSYPNLIKA